MDAAALRALADQLDFIEALATEARDAKTAYQADPSDPKAKAAHRAASQALNDARDSVRSTGVSAVDTSPGSITISPAGALGRIFNADQEG